MPHPETGSKRSRSLRTCGASRTAASPPRRRPAAGLHLIHL